MIALIVITLILLILPAVKIRRAIQRQADREQMYLAKQKSAGREQICFLYRLAKTALVVIACGGSVYIFIALASGETLSFRHVFNAQFCWTAAGCAIILPPHFATAILRAYKK